MDSANTHKPIMAGHNNNSEGPKGGEVVPRPPTTAQNLRSVLASAALVGFGVGVGWWLDVLLIVAVAFGMQWVVFLLHALPQRSERFFDLTGGLTFITCAVVSLSTSPSLSRCNVLATAAMVVWAARLSSFLFLRISRDGKDRRFDKLKPFALRFFVAWNFQGLWVSVVGLPVFVVNQRATALSDGVEWTEVAGAVLWVFGFVVEVVADHQKSEWNKHNRGRFVNTGLWRFSRHPNYFGEIALWIGMFLACSSAFERQYWVAALSPVTTILLLTKVSGIPMVERGADKKWGDDPEYQRYKKQVNVLIPGPRSAAE